MERRHRLTILESAGIVADAVIGVFAGVVGAIIAFVAAFVALILLLPDVWSGPMALPLGTVIILGGGLWATMVVTHRTRRIFRQRIRFGAPDLELGAEAFGPGDNVTVRVTIPVRERIRVTGLTLSLKQVFLVERADNNPQPHETSHELAGEVSHEGAEFKAGDDIRAEATFSLPDRDAVLADAREEAQSGDRRALSIACHWEVALHLALADGVSDTVSEQLRMHDHLIFGFDDLD